MNSTIWLANPRGFCAGVERAIEIVELLIKQHGAPIYVKHEVVHNKRVISQLAAKGVKFIEDPKVVPPGSILVFSAHGVSQAVRQTASGCDLVVHDATCPLVTKVHAQVIRMHKEGHQILMIGHRGHPEVEGTMGQAPGMLLIENITDARLVEVSAENGLAFVTQTTLSVDETRAIILILRERFPQIIGPAKDDICYATQNRQDAVKLMAEDCDIVIVVGSKNSSNSNRLRELAQNCGSQAYLVDGVADISVDWLHSCSQIGITAGASAPERVVQEVIAFLRNKFSGMQVHELDGIQENINFAVPKNLCRDARQHP